jgi:hypothetical protein
LDGFLRYCAHRATNDWVTPGVELLSQAGLQSAASLSASADLRFMRSCVIGGRRLGSSMDLNPILKVRPSLEEPGEDVVANPSSTSSAESLSQSRYNLRSRAEPTDPAAVPFLVPESPLNRFSSLSRLGYVKLVKVWNSFVIAAGPNCFEVIRHGAKFECALKGFVDSLPSEVRHFYE